ncbi:hypothetical protein M422DRAFT_46073 [Sphaerobolus stellatus SS14]|uniref:Unplaced genomic scaffold SPHSTscaffold_31, whole genome shotgun sequence n=1 Tax=Sphaerobolus stellatus (strain SS14) TaxID=990650 RepID=A0A0C9VUL4_SPHS4|nr:hypothetical protein M422DRAFT_46073 [Sphaerobolus stellatus SS14]
MIIDILNTSTDPDIIAVAADMIPQVFWPPYCKAEVIHSTVDQLEHTFDTFFDRGTEILGTASTGINARKCFRGILFLLYCVKGGFPDQSARYQWVMRHIRDIPQSIWIVQALRTTQYLESDIPEVHTATITTETNVNEVLLAIDIVTNLLYGLRHEHWILLPVIIRQYELSFIDGVLKPLQKYDIATRIIASRCLVVMSLILGHKPDRNVLALRNTSIFDVQLLVRILASLPKTNDEMNPSVTAILPCISYIMQALPPTVVEAAISELLQNPDNIPYSTWLWGLRREKWRMDLRKPREAFQSSISILQTIILKDEKVTSDRLLNFLVSYEYPLDLTVEEDNVLMMGITRGAFDSSMSGALLLALGQGYWPVLAPPSEAYARLLLTSLQNLKSAGTLAIALQAAWAYRRQLGKLSNESLHCSLLNALIMAFEMLLPDKRFKDEMFIRGLETIHILFLSPKTKFLSHDSLPPQANVQQLLMSIDAHIRVSQRKSQWKSQSSNRAFLAYLFLISVIQDTYSHPLSVKDTHQEPGVPLVVAIWCLLYTLYPIPKPKSPKAIVFNLSMRTSRLIIQAVTKWSRMEALCIEPRWLPQLSEPINALHDVFTQASDQDMLQLMDEMKQVIEELRLRGQFLLNCSVTLPSQYPHNPGDEVGRTGRKHDT